MMELLLLSDIDGIGKKNDLVIVGDGFALNHLLPKRKALVATPNVRRRYADQIKRRALEKETERSMKVAALQAVDQKAVSLKAKATKTGKLYGAITEDMILAALKSQHGIDLPPSTLSIPEPVKMVGAHKVKVQLSGETATVNVNVEAGA